MRCIKEIRAEPKRSVSAFENLNENRKNKNYNSYCTHIHNRYININMQLDMFLYFIEI